MLTAQIDAALNPDDESLSGEAATLFSSVLEQTGPTNLTPGHEDNQSDEAKKSNEQLFALLEERGVFGPKNLTEFELYGRLEAYQKHAPEST